MAAVVEISSYHGPSTASPTITNISNVEIRFKRADDDTADVNNPMTIPATGQGYSWRKLTRLKVTSGLSGGGKLSNLVWFASVAPADWAGTVSLYAGITPSFLKIGSAQDESAQVTAIVDANLYTSSSPLTVQAGDCITQNASYGLQAYVLQQMGVWSTATSGVKTGRTMAYRYDEV